MAVSYLITSTGDAMASNTHLQGHTMTAYDNDLKHITETVRSMRKDVVDLLDLQKQVLAEGQKSKDKAADKVIRERAEALFQACREHNDALEPHITNVLALRSPMAVDLRFLQAATRISTILERMSDIAAKNILRLTEITSLDNSDFVSTLDAMTALTIKMVKNSTKGFGRFDPDQADKVWAREEEVDALAAKGFDILQHGMEADSGFIPSGMTLLHVLKNTERCGDYATHITKQVHYVSPREDA